MSLDDIESITALKRDAAALIARARRRRTPVVITQNGRATAVLQDAQTYDEERKAFALLTLAVQGERSIATDGGIPAKTHELRMDAILRKSRRR